MRPFTEQEKRIVRSMAANDLCVSRVAAELHYDRRAIYYHLDKLKQLCGLDAKTFSGMTGLLKLVDQDEV